jgi:alkanesulfonate monooxygenase SsuD/methylene tetrahydromethanopterin reductase-like flavin-dependent oxidoreductase (luciferase family)
MAASGQRALRLAGRVADAALVSGMPDELRTSIELVRAGEREAGRPVGSTRILFWTTACVAEDRLAARAAVRGSVARRAMNSYARTQDQLAEDDRAALARLHEAHHKGYIWDTGYTDLVPERWIDRFAVAGTPDEVRMRLERALSDGADEISTILIGAGSGARGSVDQLRLFADTVVRPLRASRAAA